MKGFQPNNKHCKSNMTWTFVWCLIYSKRTKNKIIVVIWTTTCPEEEFCRNGTVTQRVYILTGINPKQRKQEKLGENLPMKWAGDSRSIDKSACLWKRFGYLWQYIHGNENILCMVQQDTVR